MKKLYLILQIVLIGSSFTFSQIDRYPLPNEGNLAGGLGLNWIDGELHYTLHFRPEISFANFGVGLDLNLDFDSKGNLRKENFNEFSDYLSVIRYVRYGLKNDPLFVKLGALDYYTLGHGSIMYRYNNSPGFDTRKIGLVLDVDFGNFGFESIYSRFGEAGVVGLRGYTRPLKFSTAGSLPVIGNLEVGVTYSGDFHENTGVMQVLNQQTNQLEKKDEGSINIVGFDIGLPLVSTGMLGIDLYFDYAKILDYGSGTAAGIIFTFNGIGLIDAQAKLERRFNNDKYIPSYFNSFYEIERFKEDTTAGIVSSKISRLANMTTADNGFYGELGISVLGLFDILGNYQRLDKDPKSGILQLTASVMPEGTPVVARAGYDKINIQDEKDLFKLDDRSYLFFELGYKPVEYLLVSMVYSWTFTPIRDKDDKVIDFTPQKRIEPRISFIYPFSFGN